MGRLRISKSSRAFLLRTMPETIGRESTLAAFDAMLGAFDDSLPGAAVPAKKTAPRRRPKARRRRPKMK